MRRSKSKMNRRLSSPVLLGRISKQPAVPTMENSVNILHNSECIENTMNDPDQLNDDILHWEAAASSSTKTAWSTLMSSTSSLSTLSANTTTRANRSQRSFGFFGGNNEGDKKSGHSRVLRTKIRPQPFGLHEHRTKSLTFVDESATEDDDDAHLLHFLASPDVIRNRTGRSSTEDWNLSGGSCTSSALRNEKILTGSGTKRSKVGDHSASSRRLFYRSNSITTVSRSNLWPSNLVKNSKCLSRNGSLASTSTTTDDTLSLNEFTSGTGALFNSEDAAAICSPFHDGRAIKKHRARRNSIQGSITPLTNIDSAQTSFFHLARSAEEWKQSLESHSPNEKGANTGNEFGGLDLSSPARSVASSRKRTVDEGSSPSDLEDLLSLSQNSSSSRSARLTTRSLSRISSPLTTSLYTTALQFTTDPLDFPFAAKSRGNTNERQLANGKDLGRSDAAMDFDSDDEVDYNDNSSADDVSLTSFDDGPANNGGPCHHKDCLALPTDGKRSIETEQDVLDTMSSYEDLKFLANSLSRESSKGRFKFVASDSWTVVPKKDWTSSRRSSFFQWTTTRLGFAVRAAGGSVNFLQISKLCGEEVLTRLEAAIALYKQQKLDQNDTEQHELRVSNLCTNGSTFESSNIFFDDSKYSARKARPMDTEKNLSIYRSTIPQVLECVDSEDLTAQLHSLDITSDNEIRIRDSMGCRLSLSSREEQFSSSVRDCRLSLDTITSGCHSLDQRMVSSNDMMMHLHGNSPALFEGRPLRLSLASLRSTGTYQSHGTRHSAPLTAAPSFEIVETPLMKKDEENWGSCPVLNRDWGSSSCCDELILKELTDRLDNAACAAGVRDSLDGTTGFQRRESSLLIFENCAYGSEPADFVGEKIGGDDSSYHEPDLDKRQMERIRKSYAKHKRMSVLFSAASSSQQLLPFSSSDGPFQERRRSQPPKSACLAQIGEGDSSSQVSRALVGYNEKTSIGISSINDAKLLTKIFSFLTVGELLLTTSLVCTHWADAATLVHADILMSSVCCNVDGCETNDGSHFDYSTSVVTRSVQQTWEEMIGRVPWGRFLAEGGMKKVYKVFNTTFCDYEAVSVMDMEAIQDVKVVGAELAVSAMLSSLARRNICPNFLLVHGIFTCPYSPPKSHWGCPQNNNPLGDVYDEKASIRRPRRPGKAHPHRFHYIRTELCSEGDTEEFIKRQPNETLCPKLAQIFLFQIAFALHAAAVRFSVKHYDIKLLNVFVHRRLVKTNTVVRYGVGSHMFALKMSSEAALIAKLADYGTANVDASTNGRPVTLAQFTTLENTPADYLILGDRATQGHGHDCFGLGLCMLHLFTGHKPYEEIMESVKCPQTLKKNLRLIWENDNVEGYDVIRSVVLSDVYKDEAGHITEGEPDETLYDTLYRFLVLFGIPEEKFQQKECPLIWRAITETLEGSALDIKKGSKPRRKKNGPDTSQYLKDCRKFSIQSGSNIFIARARAALNRMEGGMCLLLNLCSFDPRHRASALDVLNSIFMMNLRESPDAAYNDCEHVDSYTSFATHR